MLSRIGKGRTVLRYSFFVLVVAVVMSLAVATVATARVDEFGGTSVSAPYTEKYAGTDNIGPHVPTNLLVAPYTEKPYAGTENIAPHVPSDQIKQYEPFHPQFWGQYLEF